MLGMATHRGSASASSKTDSSAPASTKTGSKQVDDVMGDAFKGPGHSDDSAKTPLAALYEEALAKGKVFSLGRAVKLMLQKGTLDGYEAEVNAEMSKRMGRQAQGFWVPYDAPIHFERRNLTVSTSPGAVTAQIPYMLMIDVLRPKLAIARLGGRILNLIGSGPKGDVELSTKSAAATVSWVTEGNPPSASSNLTVQGFRMTPKTASAYSDVTRRMITLGAPGFEEHVVDDIATGIAVAVDGAALAGVYPQPNGLFQLQGIPTVTAGTDSGNGGVPTYATIVAMNEAVGYFNGDSPTTARMGWVCAPQVKSTLLKTDKGGTTTTGRFCWEHEPVAVNGEIVNFEHMLGYPAVATTLAPAASTEGSATTICSLAHGNFDDCWVNLFSGFDCIVNPFLQSTNGVVRISWFQDVDVHFVRKGSFCVCSNIIPS